MTPACRTPRSKLCLGAKLDIIAFRKGDCPLWLTFRSVNGASTVWSLVCRVPGSTRLTGKDKGELKFRIADPLRDYKTLDHRDRVIVEELESLLREADDEVRRHIRTQIRPLKDAGEERKRRIQGED